MPAAKQAAPTEADVRPYLEAVFAGLQKKPVQMQLLGRDKLTGAGIRPLLRSRHRLLRRRCGSLPFSDAVKLLRNLYAAAAADADKS